MKSFLNPPDGAAPFMLKNFKAILNKIGASTSKSGLAKFECTFKLNVWLSNSSKVIHQNFQEIEK